MTKVAITGAAVNLGGLLARGMKDLDIDLNLFIHKKDVSDDLKNKKNASVFKVDLADQRSLDEALENVDVISILPEYYSKQILKSSCLQQIPGISIIC